jgi:MFS family permease
MLYYTLHYPAKFPFVQQIFDRTHYQSLTGLMEVQGQTAMMIAGGLGGWMTDHVPLWIILLIDASTYATSFVLMASLPYQPTHVDRGRPAAAPASHLWRSVADGWQWLRDRPRLAWFFTCSLMPFVVVMVGNYLFPIYVAETLHAGAALFGAGEIVFAFGAIAAGFFLPRLLHRSSAETTIPLTMLVFIAGLTVLLALRQPVFYLVAGALLGFGNAGSRVARSALLLHLVPNAVMGRVTVFYNLLDRLLRTGLVGAMAIIDTRGPPAGYLVLLALTIVAFGGLLATRRAAAHAAEPAAA